MVEQAVNRLLMLDPEAEQRQDSFDGKVIHIHISDFNLNYYLIFSGGSLVVQPSSERAVDAAISGKSSAYIAAASASHASDAIFSGQLNFSGDVQIARQFQSFVQSLQLDWQQPVSEIFGDVITQKLGEGLSQLGQWFGLVLSETRQDIPEYLQHELQLNPSQSEMSHFLDAVDEARSHVDRLSARIDRLHNND